MQNENNPVLNLNLMLGLIILSSCETTTITTSTKALYNKAKFNWNSLYSGHCKKKTKTIYPCRECLVSGWNDNIKLIIYVYSFVHSVCIRFIVEI